MKRVSPSLLAIAVLFLVLAEKSRSFDGFSAPAPANSAGVNEYDDDLFPSITSAASNAWVSLRMRGSFRDYPVYALEIVSLRSTNGGITWGDEAEIDSREFDQNGGPRAYLFPPQVAGNGSGQCVGLWRAVNGAGEHKPGSIYASRSLDAGASWSPPISLDGSDLVQGQATELASWFPAICSDFDERWIAMWAVQDESFEDDSDIYRALSVDGGATWSSPISFDRGQEQDSFKECLPQMATDGNGLWITTWIGMVQGEPGGSIIFVSRSEDNGDTWSVPAPLQDFPAGSFNGGIASINQAFFGGLTIPGWARIVTNKAGGWLIAWSFQGFEIVYSRSTDNGKTWGSREVVIPGPDSDYVGAFLPDVAADSKGNVAILWNSFTPYFDDGNVPECGYMDVRYSRSSDNGTSWSAPVPFGKTPEVNDLMPSIKTSGTDAFLAVWTLQPPLWFVTVFGPGCDRDGGPYGQDSDILFSVSKNLDATLSASKIAHSVPAQIPAGQSILVGVTMKNTGDEYWNDSEGVKLALVSDPCGLWGYPFPRLNLHPGESVAPGEKRQFVFPLTAPSEPGVCAMEFQMVQEFQEFFGEKVALQIEVIDPPNAAVAWALYE